MNQKEPIFNIQDKGPLRFAGVLLALHALFTLTPVGRSESVSKFFLFRPFEFTDGTGWVATIGHAFAHASWGHVFMNVAMMVIFAIPTLRGARALAVREGRGARGEWPWVVIFFAGVITGAFAQWAWWAVAGGFGWEDIARASAVGASGGVSALFASTGWAIGGRKAMMSYGLAWAAINALLVFAEPILGMNLAWPAHLGGYLGGMIFAPMFVAASSSRFGI